MSAQHVSPSGGDCADINGACGCGSRSRTTQSRPVVGRGVPRMGGGKIPRPAAAAARD